MRATFAWKLKCLSSNLSSRDEVVATQCNVTEGLGIAKASCSTFDFAIAQLPYIANHISCVAAEQAASRQVHDQHDPSKQWRTKQGREPGFLNIGFICLKKIIVLHCLVL